MQKDKKLTIVSILGAALCFVHCILTVLPWNGLSYLIFTRIANIACFALFAVLLIIGKLNWGFIAASGLNVLLVLIEFGHAAFLAIRNLMYYYPYVQFGKIISVVVSLFFVLIGLAGAVFLLLLSIFAVKGAQKDCRRICKAFLVCTLVCTLLPLVLNLTSSVIVIFQSYIYPLSVILSFCELALKAAVIIIISLWLYGKQREDFMPIPIAYNYNSYSEGYPYGAPADSEAAYLWSGLYVSQNHSCADECFNFSLSELSDGRVAVVGDYFESGRQRMLSDGCCLSPTAVAMLRELMLDSLDEAWAQQDEPIALDAPILVLNLVYPNGKFIKKQITSELIARIAEIIKADIA